ncbi:MAG: sigma-70 family RNA polymerase sigma factor [Solitalea sp.]
MTQTNNADASYWKSLKCGNPDALGYFYERYAAKLFAAAYRMSQDRDLAMDAVQETFVVLWNYRQTLGDIRHSQGYLVKVMRSVLLKTLRAVEAMVQEELAGHCALAVSDVEEQIVLADAEQERKEKLNHALSQLSHRQKTIVELHFYKGLTREQIAARLGINYQSANNLLFRSMAQLRRFFQLLLALLVF